MVAHMHLNVFFKGLYFSVGLYNKQAMYVQLFRIPTEKNCSLRSRRELAICTCDGRQKETVMAVKIYYTMEKNSAAGGFDLNVTFIRAVPVSLNVRMFEFLCVFL
jgi:hypothetical protein